MGTHRGESRSLVRVITAYGVISLAPVLILGLGLTLSYRAEARRHGVAQGRSEAVLVAQMGIEPVLDGRPLSGLTQPERDALRLLLARAVSRQNVLRLRVRDIAGRVVFSDDGSGFNDHPEDAALQAATGQTIARLTYINADNNDAGRVGPPAVEVYMPLMAGRPAHRVGVLEVYLPYAPIATDINAGLHRLRANLALGLAGLWLVLLGISWSMSRGLRSQVAANKFQAEHDSLTLLPNRALFRRRAQEALAAAGPDRPVAIAIVDLDRFKEVNDTLGHNNGDRLLAELADRLYRHGRRRDTVARLGGDEFGVVLVGPHDATAMLTQMRDLIADQLEINGLPLAVEASIGFVVAPDDGTDIDMLLQRADVAMYVAKAQHSGIARYDVAEDHYDAANLTLVAQLRGAIDEEQLVLHYQPKTALADGKVEAVEALVRWQHPTLGLLGPDRFLPLAEQTELIDRLTTWVLTRALTDAEFLARFAPELSVAVNVSARNLARPDFAAHVADLIAASGMSPDRLIIEITETALLTDPIRAATVLADLAATGVRISLDDFGCGQTSLGYLSALPVHELKIDKSFVSDMLINNAHAAIVRSIVDLGHNLALRVVGEGVETQETLSSLRQTGCDVAQGYLLARPMPAAQLQDWLRDYTRFAPRTPTLTHRR